MTNPNGAAATGGPATPDLTDAEKLAALDMYLKALKPYADALRARVTGDLQALKVEKVGAYLPDGTRLGSVSYRKGSVSARVTDDAAALRWAMQQHPGEVMQMIRSSFLKVVLDASAKAGTGVDPTTGEALDFIEVTTGPPGVTVTTTPEGKLRMMKIASGFAGLLEGPKPEPTFPANDPYGVQP